MVRLGIDLYSLRSQQWSAFQYLDYCAAQGVKVVHFSEVRFLGGLDEPHLVRVRAHAERLGLEIEIGTLSICPTSNLFDASLGPAEEQLSRMIRSAGIVGSPLVRAVLGNRYDRRGDLPIEAHIENTLRVLRSVRTRALDAGIRIAIENHGGDLRASELRMLIEEAGTDFVGACLDSGNLLMTLDLPLAALECLAPYVITSHVRDSEIWRTPRGVAFRWVRMGEGNVHITEYLRRYVELCPNCALSLETIRIEPRELNCLDVDYWNAFRAVPPWEFARYLALAEQCNAAPDVPSLAEDQPAVRERHDLEASIRFCREILGEAPRAGFVAP